MSTSIYSKWATVVQFFLLISSHFDISIEAIGNESLPVHNRPFAEGSPKPDFPDDGVLRLFGMRYCPFAERVHLVLNAKHIPYHTYNIDLKKPPKWFREISSTGKVPVIQLVNEPNTPILIDSSIIIQYLDEKYPENPLFSKIPLVKAEQNLFIQRLSPLLEAFFTIVTKGDPELQQKKRLIAALTDLDLELKNHSSGFFSGDKIGILDYALWPAIERMPVVPEFLNGINVFNTEEHPHVNLAAWADKMSQDEAVKNVRIPVQEHVAYFKSG